MGIYDRDYYRQEQPGPSLRGPRTVVGTLILINVAVWLIAELLPARTDPATGNEIGRWLTYLLAAKVGSLTEPWFWWQFLSYGFAHAREPSHILFNMLGLWFLGREIESFYGRKEFLRLYLVFLVVGALVWAVLSKLDKAPDAASVVGASGAVAGVVVLFALNFPRRTLLLFFVLPVPAWLVGVLVVAGDAYGAMNRPESGIAYTVHLAGAAMAFLYYQFGWNFTRLGAGRFSLGRFKRRPKLRVHHPEREAGGDSELRDEVDRILAKIHREGETSLTRKERRILETASRQYQRKRRGPGDEDV